MNTAEKVRIAVFARNLWYIRQNQYVLVDDIATTNLLKAKSSQLKTPALKKIGKFVYKYTYFAETTFIPSALDVYNNIPKRYKVGYVLKQTHAFSVQKRRTRHEGDHYVAPLVVTLYGLKKDAEQPKELQEQSISVFGKTFTPDDLDKMNIYI